MKPLQNPEAGLQFKKRIFVTENQCLCGFGVVKVTKLQVFISL